jgi:hypothetical protein
MYQQINKLNNSLELRIVHQQSEDLISREQLSVRFELRIMLC